jgi:hypothetical protein
MRITTVHCSRCGATCTGGHSVLRTEAGALANRIEGEPYIDLCGTCVDRFLDFLRSGARNGQHAVGAVPAAGMVLQTKG